MENPIEVIKMVKSALEDVIIENNIRYLEGDITTLLHLYSADLCGIMLKFFPGATVMMERNFRKCALMVQGKVYDASGLTSRSDYHIAEDYEIGFIRKTFQQLSDDVMFKLMNKLFDDGKDISSALNLRKNRDTLA